MIEDDKYNHDWISGAEVESTDIKIYGGALGGGMSWGLQEKYHIPYFSLHEIIDQLPEGGKYNHTTTAPVIFITDDGIAEYEHEKGVNNGTHKTTKAANR